MTERVLGQPGPKRKRRLRLIPVALLLAVAMLAVVTAASGAFFPPNPSDPDVGTYAITVDENGANDVPGQKDLSLHGIDEAGLPDDLKVLWDWDETSISGGNTLDACVLLNSDDDLNANFALCLTLGNQPLVKLATTLYSCGDGRADRCTSQNPVIPLPPGAETTCSFAVTSNTDPFPGPASKAKGANYPSDTRAKCTIALDELGDLVGDSLELINTCSYPSAEPNSAPSDCVLIPRDATLIIEKDAGGDTTAFPFTVSGGGTFNGNVSDGSPETIGIISGVNTTVAEGTVPTGWSFEDGNCTGSTLNGGNGSPGQSITVKAAIGNTITCVFENEEALATPGAATSPTVIPQDKVTISGFDDSGAQDGLLHIELHASSDCTDTTPLYTETPVPVTANGDYETSNSGDPSVNDGYTIDADGTYYWKVVYDGDSRNDGFDDCNENVDVTLTGS